MSLVRTTKNKCNINMMPNKAKIVSTVAKEYPNGHLVAPHAHAQGQLVYAVSGVMELRVSNNIWLTPPACALWIPPNVKHSMRARGTVSLRSVYLEPSACRPASPARAQSVLISSLLRELIICATQLPRDYSNDSKRGHIMALILEEINCCEGESALHLSMPEDPRLRRVCCAIFDQPADKRGLNEWAELVNVSSRTLARLFLSELGVSYLYWRQQMFVLSALPRLCAGEPITRIAFDLGYETAGAFSAMFRRIMHISPSQYKEGRGGT